MEKKEKWIELSVDEDSLRAYASFYLHSKGVPRLTVDDVIEFLNQQAVIYGIRKENIEDALVRLYERGAREVLDVLVAEGFPASRGRPALLCLFFPVEPRGVSLTSDEKVDFKELNNVVVAKVGETVAVISNELPPADGMSVYGKPIKPPHTEKNVFRFGKGVVVKDEAVIARVAGEPVFDGTIVDVVPILKVSKDVDYHTGNIRFPGTIVVGGSVRDGFVVAAGRDIQIGGNVEAAKVFAGGNITVKGGVIARGQGKVWAGGNISARFVENAEVESGGNIFVERSILHSNLRSRSWVKVTSSRPGSIIGGSIVALEGVETYNLGSTFGTPTEVWVGVDYLLLDRLYRIEKEINRIMPLIEEISPVLERYKENKEALKHVDEFMKKKLKKLLISYKSLSSRLVSLRSRRSSIKQELNTYNGAVVKVKGIVYERVKIKIVKEVYTLKGRLQYAEFYLTKEGKVDIRPCK